VPLASLTAEIQYRPVRIYKPTKTTMQSAKGKTKRWVLDWDVLQGAGRWENNLMGWASSADYMQGTTMSFHSREEAEAFVSLQRQGEEQPKAGEGCGAAQGTGVV